MNKGPEVRTANGPSLLLLGRVCGCLCNGWGWGKWGLCTKIKQGKVGQIRLDPKGSQKPH